MNDKTATRQSAVGATEQPALLPPVDVVEDESGITVYADVPGVNRDNLEVHVEGDNLFIEGAIALEMPKELEATHVEVPRSRYRRVFSLSREFDPGKLVAELKNGVLSLRIPKAEHAKRKRIEISAD